MNQNQILTQECITKLSATLTQHDADADIYCHKKKNWPSHRFTEHIHWTGLYM